MAITTLAILGLAFSLDLLFGSPRTGSAAADWYRSADRRIATTLGRFGPPGSTRLWQWLVAPGLLALFAGGLVALAGESAPVFGAVLSGVVLFWSVDLRRLLDGTGDVPAEPPVTSADRGACPDEVGRIRSQRIVSATTRLPTDVLAPVLPFAALAPLSLPAAVVVAIWVRTVASFGAGERSSARGSTWLPDAVRTTLSWFGAACVATVAGDLRSLTRRDDRSPTGHRGTDPTTRTIAFTVGVRLDGPTGPVSNPTARYPTAADHDRATTLLGLAAALSVLVAALLAVLSATILGSSEPIVFLVADWGVGHGDRWWWA